MLDKIIVSDIHLGGGLSRPDDFLKFLQSLPPCRGLTINGDLLDGAAVKLRLREFEVLNALQDLHKGGCHVLWLRGNHDPSPERWTHLLDVPVGDFEILTSGGRKTLVIHGHVWDGALQSYPLTTAFMTWWWRQSARANVKMTRWAKGVEKRWRDINGVVRDGALLMGRAAGASAVVCGHTHHPEESGSYFNSGSWCETQRPSCRRLALSEPGAEAGTWRIEIPGMGGIILQGASSFVPKH